MAGWFSREIKSLDDLVGLKMRIPGLGGEVLERAGATPTTIPASELFTALQTGTIDATEWVGPYNDLALGLFRAADYYYYPGWQETGSVIEALVNRQAFEALPPDLQDVVEIACQAVNMDVLSDFTVRNAEALRTLEEEHGVQVRALPADVLRELQRLTWETLDEMAAGDELFARIYESYRAYYDSVKAWSRIAEQQILDQRVG